jgi:hypothetical protein
MEIIVLPRSDQEMVEELKKKKKKKTFWDKDGKMKKIQ